MYVYGSLWAPFVLRMTSKQTSAIVGWGNGEPTLHFSHSRPLQDLREIFFVVTDNEIEPLLSKEAVATVFLRSVDNPPVLDLNGPDQPGRNYTTSYIEESPAIQVRHNLKG